MALRHQALTPAAPAIRQKTVVRWAKGRDIHAVGMATKRLEGGLELFRKRQDPDAPTHTREDSNELGTAVTLVFRVLQSCVEQTTDAAAPRLPQHHIDVVRNFEKGRGWPSRRFLDGFVPPALPHQQHLQPRAHKDLLTGLGFLQLSDKGQLTPHVQLSLLPPGSRTDRAEDAARPDRPQQLAVSGSLTANRGNPCSYRSVTHTSSCYQIHSATHAERVRESWSVSG
ncbi:hypothetical protein ABZU86_32080 [Streptomyces sp. NPDC005271]|uniref:hypothetical protein n=2 Tax=Streptomyces TaxID=1883 RepID=UPI00339FE062